MAFNRYSIEGNIGNTGWFQLYINPKEAAKAQQLIESIPGVMDRAFEDATRRFGKDIYKKAKECLDRQMPPPGVNWAPLSTRSKQLDDRIYYLTSQLEDVIYDGVYGGGKYNGGVFTQATSGGNRSGKRYYVGVPTNVTKKAHYVHGSSSRPTFGRVAEWNARGSKTRGGTQSPARPLWGPLYMAYGKNVQILLRNAISREIKKYL